MKKIYDKFQKCIEYLDGILLSVMCGIIVIQVFFRYVVFHSLPWSEELSRYLYIWLVLLGVQFGIKEGGETRIDLIDSILRGKAKLITKLICYVVSLVATIAIGMSSIPLIQNGATTSSATLGISMMCVYLVFPVGMALASIQIVFMIVKIFRDLFGKREGND